jgi:hypothetical protein
VDERAFLALTLQSRGRRGSLGAVWVYALRAAADLRALLVEEVARPVVAAPAAGLLMRAEGQPTPADSEPAGEPQPAQEAEWPDETEPSVPFAATSVPADLDLSDLGADLEFGEAQLDDLWDDEAIAELVESERSAGLSLEEARRQGLLPDELDDDSP